MMTATQPALIGKIGTEPNSFEGLLNVTKIVDDPDSLSQEFKRVNIKFPDDFNKRKDWETIAEELKTFDQVLCVVNTRNDCRQLHSLNAGRHCSSFWHLCAEKKEVKLFRALRIK